MAANAYTLSKLHLPFPTFSSSSKKPTLYKCNSTPFISFSSHISFLSTFTSTLLHPCSRTSTLSLSSTKHRPVSAIVSFSLPTANSERAVGEKVPKWSMKGIKSFAMGELEARKLKYPSTGTEALLMGILVEGTSLASKFLRENGITLTKVREESIKTLGKGDFYFFSPEHPPLTESAQKALDWAIDHQSKSGGNGEITATNLLLGIWSEVGSPGHKILAALGFDDEKAKKLNSLSSKPDFNEG